MAFAINKGKTFTATEQVTNDKLHALVDDATVTGELPVANQAPRVFWLSTEDRVVDDSGTGDKSWTTVDITAETSSDAKFAIVTTRIASTDVGDTVVATIEKPAGSAAVVCNYPAQASASLSFTDQLMIPLDSSQAFRYQIVTSDDPNTNWTFSVEVLGYME